MFQNDNKIFDAVSVINILSVPNGNHLSNTYNRTLIHVSGSLEYENDTNLMYYGDTEK